MKSIFFLSFLGTVLSASTSVNRSESLDTCFEYNSYKICRRNNNDLLNVTDTLQSNEPYNIFDWEQLQISNISSIENNAFNNLTRVGRLYIDGDGRKLSITSKSFRGLPSLESLSINSFCLSVESETFYKLKNLTRLYLDKITGNNNGILELRLPSSLKYLDIMNTNLKNLNGKKLFSNLKNLQSLLLENTNISSLEPQVFSSLTELESLYLNKNNLQTLDLDLFSNLKKLNTLYLNSNKFKTIPNEIVGKIPSLESLNMEDNDIKIINGNVFHKIIEKKIPMPTVRKFVITGREFFFPFSEITEKVKLPSSIKDINLSGNEIFDIEDGAFSGLDLDQLDLSSNMLRNIEYKMFKGLKVRYLDLSNNNVTKVVKNAFSQSKIDFIVFHHVDKAHIVVNKTSWGLLNATIIYE